MKKYGDSSFGTTLIYKSCLKGTHIYASSTPTHLLELSMQFHTYTPLPCLVGDQRTVDERNRVWLHHPKICKEEMSSDKTRMDK
jgi:hypothetical protein